MLATMISDRWQHHDDDNDDDTNDGTTTDKVLFIDRNGHRFQYVLDFYDMSLTYVSGNGVLTAFTLATTQTTANVFVSTNGVVQRPTTAYAVSGTTLTFTEAPVNGDVIEVTHSAIILEDLIGKFLFKS